MRKPVSFLDIFLNFNSSGEIFVDIPYENFLNDKKIFQGITNLPFFLSFRLKITKWIIIFNFLFLFFGLTLLSKLLISLSISLFVLIFLSFIKTRSQSSSWKINEFKYQPSLLEKEELSINITIENNSITFLNRSMVFVTFTGSKEKLQFKTIETLKPQEKKNIIFRYKTDMGMGTFEIEKIAIVTKDDLGLFPRCVSKEVFKKVKVLPEEIPLLSFNPMEKGQALHSGMFEKNKLGESPIFLNLRDYQYGDSIRKIAWRESIKRNELIVKDFEEICSTDATIIFDQNIDGHSHFEDISSIESMRDSFLSLSKYLMDRQMRVQLISEKKFVKFGYGPIHMNLLREVIPTLKPAESDFTQVLKKYLNQIPTDSVLILLFTTEGLNYSELWELLFKLDNKRVDVHLIAYDSNSFAKEVKNAANIPLFDLKNFILIKDYINNDKGSYINRIFSSLVDKIHIIHAGENLSDVCNKRLLK